MNRIAEVDPDFNVTLKNLNALHEFKDGVPKQELIVKMTDSATDEDISQVLFGLM